MTTEEAVNEIFRTGKCAYFDGTMIRTCPDIIKIDGNKYRLIINPRLMTRIQTIGYVENTFAEKEWLKEEESCLRFIAQPKAKEIDWEQRTWEMATKLALTNTYSYKGGDEQAIRDAMEFVEVYKELVK